MFSEFQKHIIKYFDKKSEITSDNVYKKSMDVDTKRQVLI